jgi:ribosomal protein S18 acetylase RimI-like enzyme
MKSELDLIWEAHMISAEEAEESIPNYFKQESNISKNSGIHVSWNKSPYSVIVEKDKVIGVIYTQLTNDTFSFDVVVDKAHQGKGYGAKLIDSALSEFKMLKLDMPELKLEVEVVNKNLLNFLKKRGLVVLNVIQGTHIMAFPQDVENNE